MRDQLLQVNKDSDARAASDSGIAMSSVRLLSKIANSEDLRRVVKEAGIDPDKTSSKDVWTAFREALRERRIEDAKLLVAAGADPKQIDDVEISDREIVKDFILADAKINWNRRSWGFLLESIRENDVDLIKKLIARGVDLNSLIEIAVEKHYTEITKILLAEGANPDKEYLFSPLIDIALKEKQIDIFKALIAAGAKLTEKSKAGWTFIMDSVNEKDLNVVNKLITGGADLSLKEWGKSLIGIAVEKNLVEIVKTLLANGADPNESKWYGDSLISIATRHNYPEIVEALLASGADPNAKSSAGNALIVYAVVFDYTQIVEALLSSGADPNTATGFGHSMLDEAVIKNNIAIAKALIAAGADLKTKDESGFSTLERAELRGQTELVKLLKEKLSKSD